MTALGALARRFDSPLVTREALVRARSWSTPVSMTLYLCLLGGFAFTMFSLAISRAPNNRPDAADMADAVFLSVAFQLALALLFVPPLAAGAISGERERGTFDMLLVGRMSPGQLVTGKLVASVSYLALLLVASLPVMVAVFLYAGLDLGQLFITQMVMLVTAVTLGAVAIFLSAVSSRTMVATVSAYAIALGLYVGTVLIGAIPALDETPPGASTWAAHPLLFANPFYALSAVTTATSEAGTPVGDLAQRIFLSEGNAESWGPTLQPWQFSILFQLALSGLALWIAARVISGRRFDPRELNPRRLLKKGPVIWERRRDEEAVAAS